MITAVATGFLPRNCLCAVYCCRQPGLLVILLCWTCLVACSPSVLEHCSLGTWSAFRFARIAPSALATRLRPLNAVCLCRLLAVFLVHAGITIIVQTQTHSLTHSLPHSLPRSLTHSLTHSLSSLSSLSLLSSLSSLSLSHTLSLSLCLFIMWPSHQIFPPKSSSRG